MIVDELIMWRPLKIMEGKPGILRKTTHDRLGTTASENNLTEDQAYHFKTLYGNNGKPTSIFVAINRQFKLQNSNS